MADRTLDPAVSFYRLESTSIHKALNRGPIDGIRTSHGVACVQRDRSRAVNTNTAYLYKRCIHNTSSEPAVGYKFQQILHLLLWNDFLISPCQQKRDTKQHPISDLLTIQMGKLDDATVPLRWRFPLSNKIFREKNSGFPLLSPAESGICGLAMQQAVQESARRTPMLKGGCLVFQPLLSSTLYCQP
ncbi:hypothetical protein OUZ56_013501 [Daphnia magna]|uniref:Uncharacterized protein n=1 Tax=Daphnia magna TaxID=35525 RepID=A0ABQ9Z658_9CRUS|nr:hypothetical protein OUZ56_013501 [Daphnia magna]